MASEDPFPEAPAPAPGGLGQRIINGILYAAGQIVEPIRRILSSAVDNTVKRWIREAEDSLNAVLDGLVTKIGNASRSDSPEQAIRAMVDPLPLVAALVAIGGVIGPPLLHAVGQWSLIQLKRPLKLFEYAQNRASPLERLGVAEGVMATQRQSFTLGQLAEDLRDLGWSDDRITAMVNAAYHWPTVDQAFDLYNRGEIAPDRLLYLLRGTGLTDEQAIELSALAERIPPATDVIRFSVREAFSPGLEGEQMANYPGAVYEQYMGYLGFPPEVSRLYWRAHWDLPSLTQAYTMFHRFGDHRPDGGRFPREAVRELLVMQDVLPRYHEELIDSAFTRITRIDIRRLYTSGVYDRGRVYLKYLDLGFSPEDAEDLTEYATRGSSSVDRDLTKTEVINAYKRRQLDRGLAQELLEAAGYSATNADLLLDGADYDLQQQKASRRTTVIRQRFLNGLLSSADAVNELSALGKPPEEIDELVTLWIEQLNDRTERPTPAQLLGMYRDRVISGPDLAGELRSHGYDDRYVGWFIAQADAAIAEEEKRKSDRELEDSIVSLPIPTRGDLSNWLRRGIISPEQFTERLLAQGYTAADVSAYAASVRLPVAIPYYGSPEGRVRTLEAKLEFQRDIIDAAELRRRLSGLGYPVELADAIADYEELKLAV